MLKIHSNPPFSTRNPSSYDAPTLNKRQGMSDGTSSISNRDKAIYYVKLGNYLRPEETITFIEPTPLTRQRAFLKAITLDPALASAYNNLGTTLRHDETIDIGGQVLTQQQLFRKAIQLDPHYANAYYNIAVNLQNTRHNISENDTIITCQKLYLTVINLNSCHADAYNNLGTTLGPNETIEVAGERMTNQQLFLEAIALNPNLASAYCNLGPTLQQGEIIALKDGQKLSQQQLYLKAISLDPYFAVAYLYLGTTLDPTEVIRVHRFAMRQGDLFRWAIELNPYLTNAYYHLGTVSTSVTFSNDVIMTKQELFLKAISLDPSKPIYYKSLGLSLEDGTSITLGDGRSFSKYELESGEWKESVSCMDLR